MHPVQRLPRSTRDRVVMADVRKRFIDAYHLLKSALPDDLAPSAIENLLQELLQSACEDVRADEERFRRLEAGWRHEHGPDAPHPDASS